MMSPSLCRRAVGDGAVGPAGAGLRLARSNQPVNPRLDVIPPDAGETVGESEDHGDEQSAETEQPEFGERFRKAGFGEVDQHGSVDGAQDREPAADRGIDHHLDRRHDADKGWRHESDLKREHGPADGGENGADAEGEDLEIGDAVAGEADPVFLVAHRDQDAAELRVPDELGDEDADEQQAYLEEVEHDLGVVGTDVPALQRTQIGHAVDAAGVALLTHDQDGQDRRDGLRDDGEIGAADAALEHRSTDDQGKYARHQDDGGDGEGEAVERLPEERQRGDLIPVHEIGNAGGRLDLGVLDAGSFQLEE